MFGIEEVAVWTAVGVSAFMAGLVMLVVLAVRKAVRSQRAAESLLQGVLESASRSEGMLSELAADIERSPSEPEALGDENQRTNDEARHLRLLSRLGADHDLDAMATTALEHVTEELESDGAAVIVFQTSEERFSASYGLSAEESHRELVGMPLDLNDAQAVTIRYRYSREEEENDVFRLTTGLAVPLQVDERHIGTLAVFWRRIDHDPAEADIARLESIAELLGAPIEKARRLEEIRSLADLDPDTHLPNERYFRDRLQREMARARRYERRLALLTLRVHGIGTLHPGHALLGLAGSRVGSAVRSADVACYLGGEQFAVILPEVGLAEANWLYARLEFVIRSLLFDDVGRRISVQAAAAELDSGDSADSFVQRALVGLGSSSQLDDRISRLESRE